MKKVFLFLLASSCLIVACNSDKKDESTEKKDTMSADNKPSMSSAVEKNMQTALAAVKMVNSGDLDGAFKLVTADGVDYNDGSTPPTKDTAAIKAGIKAWLAAFPDVKQENLEAYSNADGSKILITSESSGTFKNDFMGMKATGKSFKYFDGEIFGFNSEGKITSHRSIQSNMTMMSQIGAKMGK